MVLGNLLTNAIKFTRQGEVRLLVSESDGDLKFQVSDTGIGIPPERIATLFDPFRQAHGSESRRAGGVGLGLYIVARLVALMHGTISVASEQGQGTRFTLRLAVGGSRR